MERDYLELIEYVIKHGQRQKNRTGIDTFMIPGASLIFNLDSGFPLLTTKKMAWKSIVGELLAFIRGCDSAEQFRELGCKIWDANANDNAQWLRNAERRGHDDLGRIYGVQWRQWRSLGASQDGMYEVHHIDQLGNAIRTILTDPTSRRIIVSAWNPGELNRMALPPCHLLYQFLVGQATRELHMTMYMRSCDMFLGIPFNIASYALLLEIVARATNYRPGKLTMFLADVHVYENHLDQVREQLIRMPRPSPKLFIQRDIPFPIDPHAPVDPTTLAVQWIEELEPDDFLLDDYRPYPPIKAEMAV